MGHISRTYRGSLIYVSIASDVTYGANDACGVVGVDSAPSPPELSPREIRKSNETESPWLASATGRTVCPSGNSGFECESRWYAPGWLPLTTDGHHRRVDWADVAKANQRLQDLSDEVQAEQESVNADDGRRGTARDTLPRKPSRRPGGQPARGYDANAATPWLSTGSTLAAATLIMNGPRRYLSASSSDEIIGHFVTAAKIPSASSQAVTRPTAAGPDRAGEQESAARLAKQKADKAAADAKASQDAGGGAHRDPEVR